jgi:hypothetical protein
VAKRAPATVAGHTVAGGCNDHFISLRFGHTHSLIPRKSAPGTTSPAQHHAGQPGARRLSSEFIAKRGMMQLRLHKSP